MESILHGNLASKPVQERVERLHYRILKLDFRDITTVDNALLAEILETLVPLFQGTDNVGVIAVLRDVRQIDDIPTQPLLEMMQDNLFAMAWHVPSASLYREGRKLQLHIDQVVPTRIVASQLEAVDFVARIGVEKGWLTEEDRNSLVNERLRNVSARLVAPALP